MNAAAIAPAATDSLPSLADIEAAMPGILAALVD